ncbi:hypothetical protein LIA77_04094 [Sarocladium implicatum]|nr:hypothetical protein LIA77_04094 [Sarocladium implicatum]
MTSSRVLEGPFAPVAKFKRGSKFDTGGHAADTLLHQSPGQMGNIEDSSGGFRITAQRVCYTRCQCARTRSMLCSAIFGSGPCRRTRLQVDLRNCSLCQLT